MPEILTESFCERCGTRYTFESAAPTKTRKLGKFKTLSKGLKNYVLSDDTSLDEAMAAARSDEERELTVQQLDAFHATFNFCMTCRQYTCGNCWNEAEGRCLTCAPHLGHEIMPAPFPTFRTEIFAETEALPEPERLDEAWPTTDLRISDEPIVDEPVAAAAVDAESNGHYDVEEFDVAARLAGLTGGAPASEPAEAVEPLADVAATAAQVPDADAAPEATVDAEGPVNAVEVDAVEAALPEAADIIEPEAVAEVEPEAVEPVTADAPEPLPTELDERAAAAAARTSALLNKFRPGQNIDDELAAFEASLDDTDVAATAVEATPEPVAAVAAEPETVAAEPEAVVAEAELAAEPIAAVTPEPEPVAAIAAEPEAEPVAALPAEPEPVAVEPEPVAAVAAEPEPVAEAEPEPVAAEPEPELVAAEPDVAAEAEVVAEQTPEPIAAAPEPEPAAAASPEPAEPRTDRVEQPTWRIVAPDVPAPATNGREPGDQGQQPAAASAAPAAPTQPQWPATPQWPTAAPAIPYVNDRLTDRSTAALWAASAREVASLPVGPGPAPTAGVQPCANCGLSLSATARFCRRCGSRQGS